jgi:hypothetical protein
MEVTVFISGLIALVMQSRGAPAGAPIVASVVDDPSHKATVRINASEIVDDASLPKKDADGYINIPITGDITLDVATTTAPDLTPSLANEYPIGNLIDVQHHSDKKDVLAVVDTWPNLKINSGRLVGFHDPGMGPWYFCAVDTAGKVMPLSCSSRIQRSVATVAKWTVKATKINIGATTIAFKSATPTVYIENEGHVGQGNVLLHFKAVYEKVLGEKTRSKQKLPHNLYLLMKNAPLPSPISLDVPGKIVKWPSFPERCPLPIVYRKDS